MLLLLAQLHCAIELVPSTDPSPRPLAPVSVAEQSATGIEHVFDYIDALSGERLTPGDVGALVPVMYGPNGALPTRVREDDEAGAPIRRFIALPTEGEYTVRVDGLGSRRYFGCEGRLPAAGNESRQVRITLLPRARDVSLTTEVERVDTRRELPVFGQREVELRADARSERDLEIFRGTCSGEHPAQGSHWCVLSLAANPGVVGLAARAPSFGVAAMTLSMTDPARSIGVQARYPGHVLGTVSLRLGTLIGVLHGDSPGAVLAVDVPTRSEATGDTCPIGDTCIRGLVHLGATYGSYRRDTELVGPSTRVLPDGETGATYGLLELGAGVTVAPGGTGDRLRLTGLLAGVLAARTEERRSNGAVLSEASSRLGLMGDVLASVRFAGPWTVFAGLRAMWLPTVGSRGRQFSYLGAAPISTESASLLQLGLLIGVGVDP